MTQWTKDKAENAEEQKVDFDESFPKYIFDNKEKLKYGIDLINKEIGWAKDLGFNSLRVYLHDLLWDDPNNFSNKLDTFLDVCSTNSIKPILVLFDDCHRPYPKKGRQPLPVTGVHNSGWKQSPGMELVHAIHDETITPAELIRLETFVKGILKKYKTDNRILMWDLYNEPGQFGVGEKSLTVLNLCNNVDLIVTLGGASVGEEIIELNAKNSDVITFHTYESGKLEETIVKLKKIGRPVMCTEYMAREFGTTFQFSMPIFKNYNIGCYNWGLVAGKSQTHFGWATILDLHKKKENGDLLQEGDNIPEPKVWFHDILRVNGSPYDKEEVAFIKKITAFKKPL